MNRRQLRIAPTLTLTVGCLVAVSMATVTGLHWYAGHRIVGDLGARLLDARLQANENWLRLQLAPLRRSAARLARSLRQTPPAGHAGLLRATLDGSPHVDALLLAHPGAGRTWYLRRAADHPAIDRLRDDEAPGVPPVAGWSLQPPPAAGQAAFLVYRQPLDDGPHPSALVGVGLGLDTLGRRLARLARRHGDTPFLLRGMQTLLARPDGGVAGNGLPTPLHAAADIVLANIGRAEASPHVAALRPGDRLLRLDTAQGVQVIALRHLAGFDRLPLVIGMHTPRRQIGTALHALWASALAALALLLLSLGLAHLVSSALARPVVRVTRGVAHLGRLELDAIRPVATSRIRELNDLVHSFNLALHTLQRAAAYVPDRLVERMLTSPSAQPPTTRKGTAVILFTDIVGFSAVADGLPAAELARFLNDVLGMQARCVDRHGGVVDKYIGDAVMAFWEETGARGAGSRRACAAALDIARELATGNTRRRHAGLPPVRLRIGLHRGPVVIGDIGLRERSDYTVIGDTVNIAQRLEALGKRWQGDRDVVILASAGTLAPGLAHHDRGRVVLPGHTRSVQVLELRVQRTCATRADIQTTGCAAPTRAPGSRPPDSQLDTTP